jgi:hypothetical protein
MQLVHMRRWQTLLRSPQALILLLHVIQQTEDHFKRLVAGHPDPIHKVEAEYIPVSMAFPSIWLKLFVMQLLPRQDPWKILNS